MDELSYSWPLQELKETYDFCLYINHQGAAYNYSSYFLETRPAGGAPASPALNLNRILTGRTRLSRGGAVLLIVLT